MHLQRFKVNLIDRGMENKAQRGLRPSFRRNLRQDIFAGEAIRKEDREEFVAFSLAVPFFGFDHPNRMRRIGSTVNSISFRFGNGAPSERSSSATITRCRFRTRQSLGDLILTGSTCAGGVKAFNFFVFSSSAFHLRFPGDGAGFSFRTGSHGENGTARCDRASGLLRTSSSGSSSRTRSRSIFFSEMCN